MFYQKIAVVLKWKTGKKKATKNLNDNVLKLHSDRVQQPWAQPKKIQDAKILAKQAYIFIAYLRRALQGQSYILAWFWYPQHLKSLQIRRIKFAGHIYQSTKTIQDHIFIFHIL